MTDYKSIKGKKIKFFTSDLSGESSEGQLYYLQNSGSPTAGDFKTVVASAAFSAGGNLITARGYSGGGGTQTAGIYFGGNPDSVATENYNGTGWSVGGNLNTGRETLGGAGTQTAALAFGGNKNPDANSADSEEYNGTSWSEGNNLNTAKQQLPGAGTQTAAITSTGYDGTNVLAETEEYNGTSWSEVTDNPTGRIQASIAGSQTAALSAFGATNTPGGTLSSATQTYDGTNWTNESGTVNTARRLLGMVGSQTSAIAAGGLTAPGATANAESWDGTSWTEGPNLANARYGTQGSFGASSKSAAFVGGNPASSLTEEFNITVNTITAASWSAGGNVVNTRRNAGCLGTQTATLYAGGFGPPTIAHSEEYNGTAWTEGNNLTRQRECATTGFGTQTAGAVSGGNAPDNITSPYSGYSRSTDHYDGTSWSEGGLTNTARLGMASCGTLTAGFGAGGYTGANHPAAPPSNTVNCEQYDGSSWTEVANLNTAKSSCGHFGTQTASLAIRGAGNNTESWNGSSWTNLSATVGAFNGGNHGAGVQTSGLVFGPRTNNDTEEWNGTTWFTNVRYGTSRGGNSAGTSSSAILVGGYTGSANSNATEEFTNQTTALNLKTITDS